MSEFMKWLRSAPVEWKPLGEVANIERGKRVTKKELIPNGKYPVYSGGVTPMGYYHEANKPAGTVTVVKYGSAGFVNFIEEKFWANDVCYCIAPSNCILSKYIYYVLKNSENNLQSLRIEAFPAHLPTDAISNFEIPIPSMEVQEEIVRILDKFTELIAALNKELELRRKQYDYYLHHLLTFDPSQVTYQPLGEVLVRTRGTKITAAQMRELHKDNAPVKIFAGGKTVAYVDYDDVPQKDIHRVPSVIVKSRGIIEFEYYDKPFTHKSEMWSYHSEDSNVDIKFVYYFLKTKEADLQYIGNRMQMPQISIPDTDNLLIPIPPLEEQERIVGILDKFERLTHSLSEGLPREIELRQKQYEYYRNLLLSFE